MRKWGGFFWAALFELVFFFFVCTVLCDSETEVSSQKTGRDMQTC